MFMPSLVVAVTCSRPLTTCSVSQRPEHPCRVTRRLAPAARLALVIHGKRRPADKAPPDRQRVEHHTILVLGDRSALHALQSLMARARLHIPKATSPNDRAARWAEVGHPSTPSATRRSWPRSPS